MPAVVVPPGETHIADHADEAAAGNKRAETVLPHAIQLLQKLLVILDEAKLVFAATILLERPIGRRGNDQVRFQLSSNMLNPLLDVYAPWRDQDFVKEFPGRKQRRLVSAGDGRDHVDRRQPAGR